MLWSCSFHHSSERHQQQHKLHEVREQNSVKIIHLRYKSPPSHKIDIYAHEYPGTDESRETPLSYSKCSHTATCIQPTTHSMLAHQHLERSAWPSDKSRAQSSRNIQHSSRGSKSRRSGNCKDTTHSLQYDLG
ncbi:unnamed protein product [Schistosoma curassoni]|nr:unnamed protein product [Schistosoma curassoni]